MPELPEVETVARQLSPCVEGRTVRRLRIFDPRLRDGPLPRTAGMRFVRVSRSGKRVLFELAGDSGPGRLWLAVHLRMTGRLLWEEAPGPGPREHLRARFTLDRGALLFVDTRRFGTFAWYRDAAAAEPGGVDPLSPGLTSRGLADMMQGSTQNLKAWLLRQDRLVGLGNIYASEILFRARLSPFREARSLDTAEVRRLYSSTRWILDRAIRNCGTTFSDFQDARGVEGSYQQFLAVYDRSGERCRRCGGTVERVVQQQRSTYHCPGCQS